MKHTWKFKIRQWLKAAVACSVALTLVLTPEVLALAKETVQKTGQVLGQQQKAKEQEDYLKENTVSGKHPGSRDAIPGSGTDNSGGTVYICFPEMMQCIQNNDCEVISTLL